MYEQGSSPSVDLSRTRLRQLAHWIRDDIDPVVAQEGHDKLRPDDVIALHEFFQALRYSNTVTTLDLRATGIHRAVMDVAGLATRWPGRLVNECDQLLDVWTARFGPLGELYPFIYDRGGRLEGIASPLQHSKDALLKRWRETYPEKIATKKSRRHGSLGFKAGHWWLNPLFAHHAGIIDLESTDGGVCCDDHGAYAVLLKDTGEVEASAENSLTYCCAHSDRGRFRLTAATPKSRQPIRILRSHNLNSIWGPKAGVRYEGLYRVAGWTLRPAKPEDTFRQEYKQGDIIFEVKFERDDPVPFTEVLKHPLSSELDDYAEYKRLQRVAHDGRFHRSHHKKTSAERINVQPVQKVAPVIPPVSNSHKSMLELPAPATPRSTFQRQKSDQLGPITSTPSPNKPSPAQSSESAQSHRSQQDAVKITSTGDASIGRKTPSFGREEDFNDKGKNKDLQTRSSLTTVFKKGMTSHFTMGPPGRTRSPRPKQLDGACSNDDKDYFSFRASGSRSRAASIGPKSSVTAVQSHRRCISSQETQKPLWSPPLWRPAGMSRTRGSVLIHQRRNAICISSGIASLSVSRLFSPETGYCRPEDIAMAKDTDKELDPSRPVPEVAEMGASEGSNPKTRLGKLVGKVKSREFKIAFRNPFERTNNDSEGRETRTASDEVEKLSPHMTE